MIKKIRNVLKKTMIFTMAAAVTLTGGAFSSVRFASAAVKSTKIGDSTVYYTQDASGVHICSDKGAGNAGSAKYKSNIKNKIELSGKINGYEITSIESKAFYGCTSLKEIYISGKVTSIGSSAFSGCKNLYNIQNKIDMSVLTGSLCLKYDAANKLLLKSVGSSAFRNCAKLEKAAIDGISIGTNSFVGCSGIKTVKLSNTKLGASAFSGCSAVKDVTLTGSTTLSENSLSGIGSAVIRNSTTNDVAKKTYLGSSLSHVMVYGRYTLNANGGTCSSTTTDWILKGADASPYLPTPKKTNYKFTGWYDGNEKCTKGIGYRKTLTAGYSGVSSKGITLDSQGATVPGTESVDAKYGADMPKINVPVKEYTVTYYDGYSGAQTGSDKIRYTFKGYYSEKGGSGTKYYNADGTSARAWNKTESATLYAAWEEKSITLPSVNREGYEFGGWSTKQNGTVEYSAGDSFTSTKNMSLYASWGASDGNINFDSQGATEEGESSISVVFGGSLPTIETPSKQYKVSFDGDGDLPSEMTVTYSFKGYYSGKNGQGEQYYNSDGTGRKKWDRTADTTLYAYWTCQGVTLPSVTMEGHSFKGWSQSSDSHNTDYSAGERITPESDITLYPVYDTNNYNVLLDSQGATDTGSSSINASYGEELPDIKVPERKYTITYEYVGGDGNTVTEHEEYVYEFDGYYTKKNGQGEQYYGSDGEGSSEWKESGNTTLYANWKADNVSLKSMSAERTGYTFKGWALTAGGNVKYSEDSEITVTQDMSLYGIWSANKYSVSLDCGSADDSDDNDMEDDNDEDNVDDSEVDESDTVIKITKGTTSVNAVYGCSMPDITIPTKTNYTFKGYFDSGDGNGQQYYDEHGKSVQPWSKDSDETLYAVWELTNAPYYVKQYTQNENGNYDVLISKRRGKIQSTVSVAESSLKINDGYYINKDKSVMSGKVANGNIPIKIYIDRKKATLKYDLNGGTCPDIENITTYWGDTVELDADNTPEKAGYEFNGWGKTTNTLKAVDEIVIPKEGCTVYAIWYKEDEDDNYDIPDSNEDNMEDIKEDEVQNPDDIDIEDTTEDTTEDNSEENNKEDNNEDNREDTEDNNSNTENDDSTDTDNTVGEETENSYTIEFESRTFNADDEKTEPDDFGNNVNDTSVKDMLSDENIVYKNGTTKAYVQFNKPLPDIVVPSRTNYQFMGYYDADNTSEGVQYYDQNGKPTQNWNRDEDVTLYAIWKLTDAPYFKITYKQTSDGDYNATAVRMRAKVKSTVSIDKKDIKVPQGYRLNTSKSVLKGTVTNGSIPIKIYFDKIKKKKTSCISSVTIGAGETYNIKVTGDTIKTAVSSSKNLAVSPKNTYIKVKGNKPCTAKITITTTTGTKVTCRVMVKKAPSRIVLGNVLNMRKGSSKQLKVKFNSGSYSNKLTYTSSNKKIVTVTAGGKVYAKSKGTAKITIKTFNGKKKILKIIVK